MTAVPHAASHAVIDTAVEVAADGVASRPRSRRVQRRQLPARFRAARVAIALCGLSLLAFVLFVTAFLIAGSDGPVWVIIMYSFDAAAYTAAGLVAWLRRPANHLGAILMFGGFMWACASLEFADIAVLVAVGQMTATVPLAVIVHVLLAFPSGRLRDRMSRALVAAGYVVCTVLQVPLFAFADRAPPDDLLVIRAAPGLQDAGAWLQRGAGAAVVAVTSVVLARRWRSAPRSQRRVLGPLYALGIFVVLFIPVSANVLLPAFDLSIPTLVGIQLASCALVPVAFVVVFLRGGFARRAEMQELSIWLGGDARHPSIRDAVAEAIGDPSLELVFAAGEASSSEFIDADGSDVSPPTESDGRGVVEVTAAGQRAGAIVYDTTVVDDDELVRIAGQVVAIAIDRERLTANLRASAAAVRASRARILDAADAERRRIARDLHDGLQSRLLLLGIEANRIGATALAQEVHAALDELREFVQGIVPSRLLEQGLCAAIEDLADRMPLPTELELPEAPIELTPSAETGAYLIVAEALSNAVKHAGAARLRVRVRHLGDRVRIEVGDNGAGTAAVTAGHGLGGLADRVDALGGELHIDSRPGTGTRVVAELPCAS